MKRVQWQVAAAVLALTLLFLPQFKNRTGEVDRQIRIAKRKLSVYQDLIKHRDDYERLQKELEAKGESLWGSFEPGDFVAELQQISDETQVPIRGIQPLAAGEGPARDSIGAQLEVEGDMRSIGQFIYSALELPGFVRIEKISLAEPRGESGGLAASILISRKTQPAK